MFLFENTTLIIKASVQTVKKPSPPILFKLGADKKTHFTSSGFKTRILGQFFFPDNFNETFEH